MKRNQTWARICFSGVLALMFLFLLPMSSFAQEKPVGKVIGITGTVEFVTGDAAPVAQAKPGQAVPASFVPWETAKFEQPVYAKDQFRTAPNSRLKILFTDQSLIALGPNSKMSVESYIYKPDEKLRQGAINVAHGLSMYIVNKSQTNAKSSFDIISPTANVSARGTNGYMSVSEKITLIANKSGHIETKNSDPKVPGAETVGNMEKNMIEKGKPPTKPTPLSHEELTAIRNFVVAGRPPSPGASKGGKTLITVSQEDKKEKEKEKEKGKTGGAESSGGGGSESSGGKSGGTGGGMPGFVELFITTGSTLFGGGPGDFKPVNLPGFIPINVACKG